MRIISAFIFVFVMAFASADSKSFTRLTILDRESTIQCVLENSEDLLYFRDIWEDRVVVPNMKDLEHWDYQMDLMTQDKSTRWLYDSHTGLCSVLSKDNMPVYHIRQFEVLNNVLKAKPHEKVVWVIEERPVIYWRQPWYDRSGWWRGYNHEYYEHHENHDDRYDHKRDHDDRDSEHDHRRDSKPAVKESHDEDTSNQERHSDKKRDDVARWTPIPVYTPKKDTEKKREPGRPMVVPESKSSLPIERPKIDERKLPGIRGLVQD